MRKIKAAKIAKILFVVLSVFPLFSYDGIMFGEKNICVKQTIWFDIIYSEGSKKSANLLAENADKIYCEIAELYGRQPQARMPVVICPKREVANAYFSVQFYNHIVIYDTAQVEELQVFSDDLLSTFRHELTHAFTYNLKNKFWTGFDKIFGDVLNPAGLFITAGWSEGATLTSESAGGEGRLNDEYAMHVVKQAKIENKFPAYDDVQGAADKYPVGAYYVFNGAFNAWLQKKFGMQKYAEFWYKCVNFKTIATRAAFKKVYGIKLKIAWKNFCDEFEIPNVASHPFKFEDFEICDFWSGEKFESQKNKSCAVFFNLVSSKDAIFFLEEKSGGVFFCSKDEAQKKNPKVKKIFCVAGVQKMSVSQDSRFLAFSYTSKNHANYLSKIKIFDMQKKRWIFLKESGAQNGAIIQSQDEYFVVFQKFFSQDKKIAIANLKNPLSQIFIQLNENQSASDFCDIQNGNFAFILKDGVNRKIAIANVEGKIESVFDLPQKMNAKNLFYDFIANEIYFSCTMPKTLPRIAKFNLQTHELVCDKNDISGGIFFPIRICESGQFVYIANFYRKSQILKTNGFFLSQNSHQIQNQSQAQSQNKTLKSQSTQNETQQNEFIAKKYNPFNYMRGLFLPVSIATSCSFDPRKDNFEEEFILPLGATYLTNNPWNSKTFAFSAGYSPYTNSAGIFFGASGGADTELFRWSSEIQSEFFYGGWKQSVAIENISLKIPFARISAICFFDEALVFAGSGNAARRSLQEKVFYAKNNASVYYTNIHKCGSGYFEKFGIAAGLAILYEAAFDMKNFCNYNEQSANLSPFLQIAIPKLVPIECKDFFVYNLPATLKFQMFGTAKNFITACAECVLFGMDIQKAIPFFSAVFTNRFYFCAGYSISILKEPSSFGIANSRAFFNALFSNKLSKMDYVYANANLGLTPNFGIVANSLFYTEFKFECRYYFDRPEIYKNSLQFLFGIDFNFAF